VPSTVRPGDVLANRYHLGDLLRESGAGQLWCAYDAVLTRDVALYVLPSGDERAARMIDAARQSTIVSDQRLLRVLDAIEDGTRCYVVSEWESGATLEQLIEVTGPMQPRRAAWLISEVANAVSVAHGNGITHGQLIGQNTIVDANGTVRVAGLAVDAAFHGIPADGVGTDLTDLALLLYAALTGRWAGRSRSVLPAAPTAAGLILRPSRVRAGVPRRLDHLVDAVLGTALSPLNRRLGSHDLGTARGISSYLRVGVGNPADLIASEVRRHAERIGGPLASPHHEFADTSKHVSSSARDADIEAARLDTGLSSLGRQAQQMTEPGMPVFVQGASVEWLTVRSTKSAPPPPFEELPERPLFAPTPPPGQPPSSGSAACRRTTSATAVASPKSRCGREA
jgi:hypothetical protein